MLVVLLAQEVLAQRGDVQQALHHHVDIVVGLDVVEPHRPCAVSTARGVAARARTEEDGRQ